MKLAVNNYQLAMNYRLASSNVPTNRQSQIANTLLIANRESLIEETV